MAGDFYEIEGKMPNAVFEISGDTTLSCGSQTVFVDTDGGAVTVTIPDPDCGGVEIKIKNIGSSGNDVTVARNGNNIEGAAADLTLTDLQWVILETEDGGDWWKVGAG